MDRTRKEIAEHLWQEQGSDREVIEILVVRDWMEVVMNRDRWRRVEDAAIKCEATRRTCLSRIILFIESFMFL